MPFAPLALIFRHFSQQGHGGHGQRQLCTATGRALRTAFTEWRPASGSCARPQAAPFYARGPFCHVFAAKLREKALGLSPEAQNRKAHDGREGLSTAYPVASPPFCAAAETPPSIRPTLFS